MAAPAEARAVLSAEGWLSLQPEAFQEEVYGRSGLVHFAAGTVIFRYGDPSAASTASSPARCS